MAPSAGSMATGTKDSSRGTTSKATEDMSGQMADSMKVFGCKIRCMARAPSDGPMDELTLVTTSTRRRRGMESSTGLTGGATRVTGRTVSRTEEECTRIKRGLKKEDCGPMGGR